MPEAGLVQVAAAEFASAVVLSAVALPPRVGPALPRIPGRALRRFSLGFAEWAVASRAVRTEVAEVDAVVVIVFSTLRRCVTPAAR